MKHVRCLLPFGVLLLMTGCPGGPSWIDPNQDYPTLGTIQKTRDARTSLIVITPTFMDLNLIDDTGTLMRHTGYSLYDAQGLFLEYVRNYVGVHDTEATRVELEPGTYLVLPDNPGSGSPVFRVKVEEDRTTTVKLRD